MIKRVILCLFWFFRVACADDVLVGGQRAREYDLGNPSGYFQTFDALQAGPNSTPRKVHVYLPKNYKTDSASYPVIYANDGQTAFFPDGDTHLSWKMQDVLDGVRDEVANVIVVAMVSDDREREYTHESVPTRHCCGLARYSEDVATNIVPFINANYRTQRSNKVTTILGSSHGGLAAFYMATRNPQIFGNAVAMSSSFWVGVETAWGEARALQNSTLVKPVTDLLGNEQQRPRFWMDWGMVRSGGFQNSFIEKKATERGREMVNLLGEHFHYRNNKDLIWLEDPNGEHDEFSWARRLPQVLKLFYPAAHLRNSP